MKYSWNKIPTDKIIDRMVNEKHITSTDPTPYVPDYFHENDSAPKNLNFTFVPAYPEEREWRAEFYDRYTEWDRVDI